MPTIRFDGAIARRPAVPAAVLFVVGVTLHRVLPVYPLVWLIAFTALTAGGIVFVRRAVICSTLVGMAIAISGCVGGQLAYWYFPRNHVGAFVTEGKELGWVEGTIDDTPRMIEGAGKGRPLPDRQLFEVRVSGVLTWGG